MGERLFTKDSPTFALHNPSVKPILSLHPNIPAEWRTKGHAMRNKPTQRELELAVDAGAASYIKQLRSERDEALALLRDVTAVALPYVPKSIRDRRTFTVNLSRAFLSRVTSTNSVSLPVTSGCDECDCADPTAMYGLADECGCRCHSKAGA